MSSLEYMSLFLKVKWMKRSGVKISSSISIILSCSKDPHLRWPPTPPKAKERRTNFQIVFRWTSMTLKKRTLLLFTLFRRRKCHLAFLHGNTTMKWWRHEEGIYWPLNQLPIITCKSYFYPFYARPLVGILAAANERNERILCTIFEDLSCCQ